MIGIPVRAAAMVALPLLLGGCAAWQPASLPPSVAQAARSFHPSLAATGRLSVRYEDRSGPQALHGSFQWNQVPDETHITLLSPLGQTVARIAVTPAGAVLEQASRPPLDAGNADALTAQALGWPLPVAGLRDWLQGFGSDAQGRSFVASPQSGTFTTADGWRLRYSTWQDDDHGSARPRRIDLERDTAEAGAVAIRIVIDTWHPL